MNDAGTVMYRIVTIWAVVFTFLLFHCSHESLTGGGTEGGNTVCGIFVDEEGIARAKVNVMLVPSDFNPVIPAQPSSLIKTTTNVNGSYSFNNVSNGDYSIEAIDSAGGKRSLLSGIAVTGEDIQLNVDTLRAPGLLLLDIPAASGYAFIPGTTILAHADGVTKRIALQVPSNKSISSVCYTTHSDSPSVVLRYNVLVDPQDTIVVTNTDWKYSCRIHLNTTQSGADVSRNVPRFPIVIRLTKDNFNFSQADVNGNDIRFARNDTIPLVFEIEQWDAKNNRAEIWVKVDTIYGNNNIQFITIYWGNRVAQSSSNSAAVFDTSDKFIGVYHLNEDPSSGANSLKDRTINRYHATAGGKMTSENSVTGVIGKSLQFDGIDDFLEAGNVSIPGTYSMGLWVKLDTLESPQRFIFKDSSYTLWYTNKDSSSVRVEHFSNTTWWKGLLEDGGKRAPLPQNEWCYLCGTFDGSVIRLYINGVEVSRSSEISIIPEVNSKILYFGKAWDIDFIHGYMDEIRLEGTARSVDWIRLCYMNQRSDDKLIKIMNYQ
jgi:hypothetical protein